MTPGRKRVFISYSRVDPDAHVAEQLHEALRGSHDVFFDRLIRTGENWERRIEQELQAADYFVVLLSEQSVNKEGLHGEIEIACEIARENQGKPIILPVRIRFDKRLPYSLFMRLHRIQHFVWAADGDTANLASTIRTHLDAGDAPAIVEEGAESGQPRLRQPSARPANEVSPKLELIRQIDTQSNIGFFRRMTQFNRLYSVVFSPDASQILTGSDDRLKVWEASTGREIGELKGAGHIVYGVMVTPDGSKAISRSLDWTIRVWDLASYRQVRRIDSVMSSPAMTPDGSRVIAACSRYNAALSSVESIVCMWDLGSGEEIRTYRSHAPGPQHLTLTPDGSRCISASEFGIEAWDLASGDEVFATRFGCQPHRVVVTADARHIVICSKREALIFDGATGANTGVFQGHRERVNDVAALAGSAHAISASEDRTVKLWEVPSGRELTKYEGTSTFTSCAASPDGSAIAAGDSKGQLLLFRWTS
jgi:hypothetical protein